MSKLGKRITLATRDLLIVIRGEADAAGYRIHVPPDITEQELRDLRAMFPSAEIKTLRQSRIAS
jgi:hypothetical protein